MSNYHKSKSEKIIQGTYRTDREKKIPDPRGAINDIPDIPDILDHTIYGIGIWNEAVEFLIERKFLHLVDLSILTAYCLELNTYFESRDYLVKNGLTFQMKNGISKQRFEVRIAKDSLDRAIAIGKQFYLNPLSRSRIADFAHEEGDELSNLLGG